MSDLPNQNQPTDSDEVIVNRAHRFESHALVDVKTGWNPFATTSAVLLDLSIQGFKIEFVNPVKLRPGATMTMSIPLAPFKIMSPSRVKLKVVVKWYDARQMRAGGVFLSLREDQKYLIERIFMYITEHQLLRNHGG